MDKELEFTNTPNLLTLSRILAVPGVVALLLLKTPTYDLLAAILFAVASFTDFLDGYYARKLKIITVYGKLMDPLADKFLVVSSLIILQELTRVHPIVVILLICREMAITSLRALASSEGVIIAASSSAKWKTATQMVAIPMLMVKEGWLGQFLYPVGQVLLFISLAISLWSAKDYAVDFFKILISRRKETKEKRLQRKLARAKNRAILKQKLLHLGKHPHNKSDSS